MMAVVLAIARGRRDRVTLLNVDGANAYTLLLKLSSGSTVGVDVATRQRPAASHTGTDKAVIPPHTAKLF